MILNYITTNYGYFDNYAYNEASSSNADEKKEVMVI